MSLRQQPEAINDLASPSAVSEPQTISSSPVSASVSCPTQCIPTSVPLPSSPSILTNMSLPTQTHFFKNTPHTIGIRPRTRPPLANNAYYHMRHTTQDQDLILSGETGSKKSETRRLTIKTLLELELSVSKERRALSSPPRSPQQSSSSNRSGMLAHSSIQMHPALESIVHRPPLIRQRVSLASSLRCPTLTTPSAFASTTPNTPSPASSASPPTLPGVKDHTKIISASSPGLTKAEVIPTVH
ncbi:hypothetical protein L210DRAFT_3641744 [Boletus edulis BED1]|uniref:Uncharacterized protein n=1 Tax=Boletus edulis BED1 TaxID=1328754 RepID=A0AAD4C432_BOLED|nr:hypothetical protein L210DRAFT_3641744 [Boletus edulis BED1]